MNTNQKNVEIMKLVQLFLVSIALLSNFGAFANVIPAIPPQDALKAWGMAVSGAINQPQELVDRVSRFNEEMEDAMQKAYEISQNTSAFKNAVENYGCTAK